MTNLYSHQKLATFKTDSDEILRFFGLLLFTGYHSVPEEDHYWSTAEDLSNNIIPKIMPRKRFRDIKTYFHLVDNMNLLPGKLAKVEPLYVHLAAQFSRVAGVFAESLSIDESMVPYYGHHSCKMFIRGKPIRFGYKVWMMCSPDGFPFNMQLYSGAKPQSVISTAPSTSQPQPVSLPLGRRVVRDMVAIVKNPTNHALYFDNFFTSYDLMEDLTGMGFRATGTVRENRTGHCPLPGKSEMSKRIRGEYEEFGTGKMSCVQWNDNRAVSVLSNWLSAEPLGNAIRYSSAEKRKVSIPQPRSIQLYNQNMGGVDVLDRLLGSYRPKLRSTKWWWNLFSNALNMTVVAAWILHCKLMDPAARLSHLDFRREVATVAMKVGLSSLRESHPGPTSRVSLSVRMTTGGHFLEGTTQGRCVRCQKNTTKWCKLCGKRLHERCFPGYHKIAQ